MVKYVLIISQYYHSHVQKICMVPDDFTDKARKMIQELEDYKRSPHEKQPKPDYYYGDLDKKYTKSIKLILEKGGRFNLNDSGDIYFILSDSVDYLANNIIEYARTEEERFHQNARIPGIMQNVSEHHNKTAVTNIIRKYFEIV